MVRALPRSSRPDLDQLVAQVSEAWVDLTSRSARLPATPPKLTVLALERRSALTVFVFGTSPEPLLVLKVPTSEDNPRSDVEGAALSEAESARITPLYLGRVGPARVQEGVGGAPLRIEPLTPERARHLQWTSSLAELMAGFTRLAEVTRKRVEPKELAGPVELAIHSGSLHGPSRELLAAAWRDIRRLNVSVLRHRDASAQNCLFADGRLVGVVDWEVAESRGAPGFDAATGAVSYLEHGLGLRRWSEELALEAFTAAWREAPFFREARSAFRAVALAADVPAGCLDALEVVFYGHRVGRRLEQPRVISATGAMTAAKMLRVVCST
jgi:hypothetical protein